MRLSVRLIALGVTGPIVGLGIFLALSASTVVDLSRRARVELTALFNQDNRSNLLLTTSMVQRYTSSLAAQLHSDSERLATVLRQQLSIDPSGQLRWQGQATDLSQASARLNPVLAMPLSTPGEHAGVYMQTSSGRFQRIAAVDSNGQALAPGWSPPAQTVREIEALTHLKGGRYSARNGIVLGNGMWRMTRLTPLNARQGQQLMLAVSIRTDAANDILETSASLFPYKKHQIAFFGYTPTGDDYCTYAKPTPATCDVLQQLMQRSGGLPKQSSSQQGMLLERGVTMTSQNSNRPVAHRLFMATFPEWNWLAVILVEESFLNESLIPLRQATIQLLVLLVGASLMLIAGCGFAAWKITEGIKRQLRILADAADGIAAGRVRMQLAYAADDALGRLVGAFNRMAAAVADREESLRARIRNLEIDINQQSLKGQVCSIVQDPSFKEMSDRAKQMRARRQKLQDQQLDP
ncbi:MAG: hypothetical protein VKM98_11250 [Cyanobacteriota bacterium]|nr:hypothetical protein [Cyanobacteriota bacterium]